ncbi:Predicted GTPase [Haemophilus parahaemolyticus]|uniref:Predicted GTPase n=1 Tax=Haemophilus parahaemolyticus TaxID=735 RepID=A0A377I3Y8_HAEPH|nr:dynamin family protein [Haemophilus parahaemolyticus]STO65059.1 Predicted GTPase [Haemophilus parahaemolyticus]
MSKNISTQLIEFNEKLFNFLQSKGLDQEVKIQNARDKNSISDTKNLKQDLDEVNNVDRLLRVGIIGRVKAGKSSLLNALIFNGRDVLPKAATPMTAALTRMEYSENVRAEVEFYDQADLEQIAESGRKYEQIFNSEKTNKLAELTKENELFKKEHRQSEMMTEAEMQQLAEDHARSESEKSIELASAYDQHQRIKAAKIQLSELQAHTKIKAKTTEDLMGKLNDYVGSGGKYMPFTKSVKLYIPEEGLKGLEIVDTPGVNDPVQSREERTNAFLAQCDVVLVVSPSGQFISEEDMALMGRVTGKNGIQEAYLIASQTDSQLFGSAREGETNPSKVLDKVTDILNAQAHTVFEKNKEQTMQKMIELYKKHKVICTSSVAYSMLINFSQKSKWDENTQHVWSNLQKYYRDYFSDDSTANMALETLSNIKRIKQILIDIQARKDQIQAERRQSLISCKISAYKEFIDVVVDYIDERIDKIAGADAEEEKNRLENFKEQKAEMKSVVDMEYLRAISQFDAIDEPLINVLDRETKAFSETNRITENSYTESYQVKDNGVTNLWGLFGDRYETKTRTVKEDVINAGAVRDFILEFRDGISSKLKSTARKYKTSWEDDVIRTILSGIREVNQNYPNSEKLNRRQINDTIQAVFRKIKITDFDVKDQLPSEINRSGKLTDYDARRFNEAASNYMFKKLKPSIRSDINKYVKSGIESLQNVDVAKGILDSLEQQISTLIHEIENREESIARYKLMQKDIAKLKSEMPNA